MECNPFHERQQVSGSLTEPAFILHWLPALWLARKVLFNSTASLRFFEFAQDAKDTKAEKAPKKNLYRVIDDVCNWFILGNKRGDNLERDNQYRNTSCWTITRVDAI